MRNLAALGCALTLGAACSDGTEPTDPNGPNGASARDFTMRVENVAPYKFVKMSSQRLKFGTTVEGPLAPGETYQVQFTAGVGHSLSFATMLLESNDWFFAPDPAGIPLYTNGVPASGDITRLIRLWDAGSELDQELAIGDATGIRQLSRDAGSPDTDNRIRLATSTRPVPTVDAMIRVTLTPAPDRTFILRIQNISTTETLVTSQGTRAITVSPVVWAVHNDRGRLFQVDAPMRKDGLESLVEAGQVDPIVTSLRYERGIATPLSPGMFVVHQNDAPLFALDSAHLGNGLESLAEDGDPRPLAAALGDRAGTFGTTIAMPNETFEATFRAEPGDKLSLATMFASSNDWFFAGQDIALFQDNDPRWGDITPELALYDAGTELDEELDVGANTRLQQSAPNTGREDRVLEVREVPLPRYDVLHFMHIRVTLTPQ